MSADCPQRVGLTSFGTFSIVPLRLFIFFLSLNCSLFHFCLLPISLCLCCSLSRTFPRQDERIHSATPGGHARRHTMSSTAPRPQSALASSPSSGGISGGNRTGGSASVSSSWLTRGVAVASAASAAAVGLAAVWAVRRYRSAVRQEFPQSISVSKRHPLLM